MANYQDLKDSISALIRQNGAQEITGDVLQGVLVSMVANLGQNYQFKGIAVPTGNPGTPDQNVFYFATQQGTYTNFGGAKIDKDSLFVLAYNGEWTAFDTGISAMPKDLNFLVDTNMAIAPYEDNVTLEMDVYNPSTASSQVKEYEIPSATEKFAGVMSAKDKKKLDGLSTTVDGLKYNKYDYLKINGLTTNSTSEQVKAALTPIGGTEVVFPTNGDTITNGTSISIEILEAASNTFSYIYNNQLVTLGFSLAEGREAVTRKVQTSLLKPMYDFAKINALTGESGNDDIEAAIKQLQTSTTTAPSAGALLVDATSLAPLAVVTDSSSHASTMTEVFSYTYNGVKYTVTISGEQGALTAKVTTEGGTKRTALTPLFEAAGATFNDETGYYEYGDYDDIDEEEMINMYIGSYGWWLNHTLPLSNNYKFRTNFIPNNSGNFYETYSFKQALKNPYVEYWNLNSNPEPTYNFVKPTNLNFCCQGATNLKEIRGIIDLTNVLKDVSLCFNASNLTEMRLKNLRVSIGLYLTPKLSNESIEYMISNSYSALSSSITITLAPDVYDRAIADEGVQAALQAHPHVSLARYEATE